MSHIPSQLYYTIDLRLFAKIIFAVKLLFMYTYNDKVFSFINCFITAALMVMLSLLTSQSFKQHSINL